MSIRRTVYIVSIDAFKENKSYAFSSSVDTFEDYKNAQCRLHEVIREWKIAIQNSSTCKEKGNYSGTPDLTINIRKREAFATLI